MSGFHFDSLTENQQRVAGLIAIGDDRLQNRRTLDSLVNKGIIEQYREQFRGGCIFRYRMPQAVHIEWCAWCAATTDDDGNPISAHAERTETGNG